MKKIFFSFLLCLAIISTQQVAAQTAYLNQATQGLREVLVNKNNGIVEKNYYDTQGNLRWLINIDINQQLIVNQLGMAVQEFRYDDSGKQTEQRFYNTNMQLYEPIFSGPSVIKYGYDEKNRRTETAYYDSREQLLNNDAAVVIMKYDDKDRIVEERYLDSKRQLLKGRAAIIRYQYDDNGRVLQESYFDHNNQACKRLNDGSSSDFSIKEYKYNEKGNIIEKTHLDPKGAPITMGVYKTVYLYNPQGRLYEKVLYDAQNTVISKVPTNRPN